MPELFVNDVLGYLVLGLLLWVGLVWVMLVRGFVVVGCWACLYGLYIHRVFWQSIIVTFCDYLHRWKCPIGIKAKGCSGN